jgi:hypothetical protein
MTMMMRHAHLEAVIVCAAGKAGCGAVHAAAELVENGIIFVQVTQLQQHMEYEGRNAHNG